MICRTDGLIKGAKLMQDLMIVVEIGVKINWARFIWKNLAKDIKKMRSKIVYGYLLQKILTQVGNPGSSSINYKPILKNKIIEIANIQRGSSQVIDVE